MFNSTAPQSYHLQPRPRAQSYTQAPTTHTRAGPLTFPSSCLEGCVTRVGPGQYPQYTRAPFGEEAVGSSQSKHFRAPQVQPMSPRQHPTRDESIARFLFFFFVVSFVFFCFLMFFLLFSLLFFLLFFFFFSCPSFPSLPFFPLSFVHLPFYFHLYFYFYFCFYHHAKGGKGKHHHQPQGVREKATLPKGGVKADHPEKPG